MGGEGRNHVQGKLACLAVVATPRGLAVDGNKVGTLWPTRGHPLLEARREKVGVHAVHQGPEPVDARYAVVELRKTAQETQVRFPPVDDVVVVVPVGDRAAYHQEQHLSKRVHHPPGLTSVLDGGEVVQQQGQTCLRSRKIVHRHLPNQRSERISSASPPKPTVNPQTALTWPRRPGHSP